MVKERPYWLFSNKVYVFLFFFSVAVLTRLVVWHLIPVDWNSDSYHHWQIAYLSLKIGFPRLRMWDLNGCELYWGLVPHVVQSVLLWAFSTASMLPYRVFNVLLGGVNAYLVYLIGRYRFHWEVGLYAGILFAVYPVAAIFDVVAMQETLALSFALISIFLFKPHPAWSGLFLALACQSRIEFWLVSIIFVLGVSLTERFSTEIQPFVFSWLGFTSIFCIILRNWTGNPIYPLYWSLFNVFGGWTERWQELPFHVLMLRWIGEKLSTWSMKATGLVLLGSFVTFLGVSLQMLRRRWKNYHLPLFFMTVVVVFSPLFVTYYPRYIRSMLLMLRESIPIAAFGSILLCGSLTRIKARTHRGLLRRLPIETVLILISVSSFCYFIPAYEQFQVHPQLAFTAADRAIKNYKGGMIVCDYPTMNYRFVSRWHVRASNLLGNHYSPFYYGVIEPMEYAKWFDGNNITLWIYAGRRAEPVWAITSGNFPDLLVLKDEVYDIKIFEVDRVVLDRILAG